MFLNIPSDANTKAIVSSRPHQAFVDAFEGRPQIKLHELTQIDITKYVDGQLRDHPRLLEMAIENPSNVDGLINNIVQSASGVFLWVKLVVRSLLEGLRNRDSMLDLKSRFEELPKGLEALFRHMLSKIEPRYMTQGAHILELLRASQAFEAIPSEIQSGDRDVGVEPQLSAIDVYAAFLSTDDVLGLAIAPLSANEINWKEKRVEAWLRTRCAGLVELQAPSEVYNATAEISKCAPHQRPVQYIHKSVADFLYQPAVWQQHVQSYTDASFRVQLGLIKAMVQRVKIFDEFDSEVYGRDMPWEDINTALNLARQAEDVDSKPLVQLLDCIDRVMTKFYETRFCNAAEIAEDITNWCDLIPEDYRRPCAWHDNFLAFSIRLGVRKYVLYKLTEHGRSLLKKEGRPLLDYACRPEPHYEKYVHVIQPQIVHALLEHEADPNERFNGFTPWQNAMYEMGYLSNSADSMARWLQILLLLLEHGADVNAFVENPGSRRWPKSRESALAKILMYRAECEENHASYPCAARFNNETRASFDQVIGMLREREKQGCTSLTKCKIRMAS